jgi:NADH:ubiquinone oxidoreductase subunit 4 (subunit M)
VLYLVWHGAAEEPPAEVGDADGLEVAVASPLVVGVFAFGLLPWLLLSVTSPAVTNLVGLR